MRIVFGPKGNTKLQPMEWTILRLMLRVYGSEEIIRMAKLWEKDGRPWEQENDWLSKEMQNTGTPAGSLPVLHTIEPGVSVVVRANGDPKLSPWDGRFGVVVEKFNAGGLWSVNIGEVGKTLVAPSYHLEVRG